jgi:hypothetical protein
MADVATHMMRIQWRQLDWKRIATVATIGLLLGLGIAIWRAGNEEFPQPNGGETIMKGTAEGRRAQLASWEFTYDRATTLGDQVTQEIDGVRNGVYYKNNKPFVRMHADRVIYNSATHDFRVVGPAHFDVDDKGKTRTLDTNNATWTEATQTLRIPGTVTIGSENGAKLTVTNVAIDLREGRYTVGRIQGSANP